MNSLDDLAEERSKPCPRKANDHAEKNVCSGIENFSISQQGHGLKTETGKSCESAQNSDGEENPKGWINYKPVFEGRHQKPDQEASKDIYYHRSGGKTGSHPLVYQS